MPQQLKYTDVGFGLSQFENDDILLTGGISNGNFGTPGTRRLSYVIWDAAKFRSISETSDKIAAVIGSCEINVSEGWNGLTRQIEGLVSLRIEDEHRRQGYGRKVVEALSTLAPDGCLNVYDIKKSLRFWNALGVTVIDSGIGPVNGVYANPSCQAELSEAPSPGI